MSHFYLERVSNIDDSIPVSLQGPYLMCFLGLQRYRKLFIEHAPAMVKTGCVKVS